MLEHCFIIPGSIIPKFNGRPLTDQDKSALKVHTKKELTKSEMYTPWVTASLKQEAATHNLGRPTVQPQNACAVHIHTHAHTLSTSGLTINVKHHKRATRAKQKMTARPKQIKACQALKIGTPSE